MAGQNHIVENSVYHVHHCDIQHKHWLYTIILQCLR